MAPTPPPTRDPERRSGLSDAQRWTLGGIAAVVVLLLVAISVAGSRDDDGDDDAATTTAETTTTTEATTTTAPEETTTTTFRPDVDPFEVAFPSPEASRSFEEPAAAARAYATDVLGFSELVLSPAGGTEGRATVEVQPDEDGPVTAIELVEAGDAWFVTGSSTEDIVVDQPAPGTSLASPFETTGEALAFEGNVEVLVLSQHQDAPLGQGTVTGSGAPPAGPFEGDITFTPPAEATPGVLVYRVSSPEDGRVLAATSIRVRLTALTS